MSQTIKQIKKTYHLSTNKVKKLTITLTSLPFQKRTKMTFSEPRSHQNKEQSKTHFRSLTKESRKLSKQIPQSKSPESVKF